MEENKHQKINIFIEKYMLDLNDLFGRSIAILGVRGSGKTNSAAVLAEELLTAGVQMVIIDVDSEYWTLKELHQILHICLNGSDKCDINITLNNYRYKSGLKYLAAKLASALYELELSIILDISEATLSESYEFLENFFIGLWNNSKKYRKPLFIIIEEAHEFLPQGKITPIKEVLTRIALRGRKRGLSLVMVTQRSARIDKDVLTQAEYFILHRVLHPADLRVYKEILPQDPKLVELKVPKLKQGEAFFYNGYEVQRVTIRSRKSFHPGYTPRKVITRDKLKTRIDEKILNKLMNMLNIPFDFQYQSNINNIIKENSIIKTNESYSQLSKSEKCIKKQLSKQDIIYIIELIMLIKQLRPSTIGHLKVLFENSNQWLDRNDLINKSKYKSINYKDFRKLIRHKILTRKKIGKKIVYRLNNNILLFKLPHEIVKIVLDYFIREDEHK